MKSQALSESIDRLIIGELMEGVFDLFKRKPTEPGSFQKTPGAVANKAWTIKDSPETEEASFNTRMDPDMAHAHALWHTRRQLWGNAKNTEWTEEPTTVHGGVARVTRFFNQKTGVAVQVHSFPHPNPKVGGHQISVTRGSMIFKK